VRKDPKKGKDNMTYTRKRPYYRFLRPVVWETINAAVETALRRMGSAQEFYKIMKTPASTVSRWRHRTRLPTIEQAWRIETETGVSRKSIRPDVDWDYISEDLIKLGEED